MKALIVKLTSMGDLVQALPALTDAYQAKPDISFDWAVDEAFSEVPLWHPAVDHVIKTAHRRWRKSFSVLSANGEVAGFIKALRQTPYDVVIDAQTNLKSALVTGIARGKRHGPDKASVREIPAHWAYQHHYAIEKNQLAIDRWRQLFSRVLDYPLPKTPADFGLDSKQWPTPDFLPDEPYIVVVPNASWDNKYWQQSQWQALIVKAAKHGYQVLVTWGSEKERLRVLPLGESVSHVKILPRMTLSEIAGMMVKSQGTIAMDTGLAHVSAALNVATVTLYGPTDPRLIGATGGCTRHLVATGFDCIPCYKKECRVAGYRGNQAQCLKTISADNVWQAYQQLVNKN